jgi:hypothetical protein
MRYIHLNMAIGLDNRLNQLRQKLISRRILEKLAKLKKRKKKIRRRKRIRISTMSSSERAAAFYNLVN